MGRKQKPKPEEWKQVWLDGYLTNYEVSSHGRVRNATTKRVKNQHLTGTGTPIVMLYSPAAAAARMIVVAVVVARAFLGEPGPDEQIEHLDQNKQNNHLTNLAYMSQSQNILRSYWYGNRKKPRSGNKYLSEASYDLIRQLWATRKYSQVEIGRVLGITNSAVSKILSGSTKPRPNGHLLLIPNWDVIGGCRHE